MQAPMFGMSIEQESRFFRYCDCLRRYGYCVLSEPLEGQIDGWLEGRFVCVDYAITLDSPNLRLRKVNW